MLPSIKPSKINLLMQKPPSYNNTMSRHGQPAVLLSQKQRVDCSLSRCSSLVSTSHHQQWYCTYIYQSKTDPFHQRVSIYLGKTGSNICVVTAISLYLALRGNFWTIIYAPWWKNAHPSNLQHNYILDILFKELHLNQDDFNTHSFHVGAATSAKAANISDTHIATNAWQVENWCL